MLALLQATTGNVDAAAVYYAALDADDALRACCPVLLHLAETDEFDPPELYDGFVAALRAAGTEVEGHTWPGTEHSFANRDVALHAPTRPPRRGRSPSGSCETGWPAARPVRGGPVVVLDAPRCWGCRPPAPGRVPGARRLPEALRGNRLV